MKYNNSRIIRSRRKVIFILIALCIAIMSVIGGTILVRQWYKQQLLPVSVEQRLEQVVIPEGATVQEIAKILKDKNVIRNEDVFLMYVRSNNLTNSLKAGTYTLDAALPMDDIIAIITDGKVQQNLITILPGKRLEQIRTILIDAGHSPSDVDAALEADQYRGHPALVAKPSRASLEGYIYPESFIATSTTTAKDIITKSLDEMAEVITPELIEKWQKQGLGIHQAVILASIVEKEVSNLQDKANVAGVFINRLAIDMPLASDPTYLYAGYITNQKGTSKIQSPYNTYINVGLPPGPISNVTKASLEAVAHPASHDYLYFVSGDDGITHFSKTLEEHEANTAKYCKILCKSY